MRKPGDLVDEECLIVSCLFLTSWLHCPVYGYDSTGRLQVQVPTGSIPRGVATSLQTRCLRLCGQVRDSNNFFTKQLLHHVVEASEVRVCVGFGLALSPRVVVACKRAIGWLSTSRSHPLLQSLISPESHGLQPRNNGRQPKSDGLQPTSNGLQPKSDVLHPMSDGLQPRIATLTSPE